MKKKLIIPISLISLIALIAVLYVSYGFVAARITNNELSKKQTFLNQKLEIEYSDGTEILTSNNTSFIPGSTITKTFTIKNTGNVKLNFKINLENVTNTFSRKEDITYELYLNDEIMLSNIYPSFDTGIAYNQTLEVKETKNYTLKIIYNNSSENQIADQGKLIEGKITFKEQPAINNIKILGNSIQNGIPTLDNPIEIESVGKKTINLFDINSAINTATTGDILSKEDNGFIATKNDHTTDNEPGATNWSSGWIQFDYMLEPNTNYTISYDIEYIEVPNNVSFPINHGLLRLNGTDSFEIIKIFELNKKYKHTYTGTSNSNGILKILFTCNSSKIKVSNIQVQKGSVATEYEPYNKYKIPITVESKNIADPRQINSFVDNISKVINGKDTKIFKDQNNRKILKLFCASGYNDSTGPVENYKNLKKILKNIFKENTQYTISFDYYNSSNNQMLNLLIKYTDGTTVENSKLNSNYLNEIANQKYTFKFTTAENKTVESIDLNYNSGSTYIYLDTLQIEEGTTKTDYVPYVEPINDVIYLDEPLRGINEFQDELDLKTGKVTRIIEDINLDGSRTWNVGTPEMTNTYLLGHYELKDLSRDLNNSNYSLSNKFTTKLQGVSMEDSQFIQVYGRHLFIRINKTNFGETLTTNNTTEDKEKIKNWLSNNPINLNYIRQESYSLESELNILNDKLNFYSICPTCTIKINTNIEANVLKK